MKSIIVILALLLDGIIPKGPAFLKQLQQRDSVLIADQLEYGFQLDSLKEGTVLALPDFAEASNDTLVLVRNWQIDTTRIIRKSGLVNIRASVIVSPFEEGLYKMPDIPVQRTFDGHVDTLLFSAADIDVKTIPVDTTTFVIHDIKGQIRYPVTFKEILPYLAGALGLAALVYGLVVLIRARRRKNEAARSKDPAHIVALRQLDKYHGDKFWAPDKQKSFYSGVTDILKTYIEERFGLDAPEMTTAELFDGLKSDKDITPELFSDTKELFETADFVKFAKHTAPDEYNARVLPVAVKFVTSTYQAQIEQEKTEKEGAE